jgi:hypothetical protein
VAARYDITIEQGASFELPLTLQHSNGTVYNLTGYTGRGQIRKYHRSASIIAYSNNICYSYRWHTYTYPDSN